MNYVYLAHSLIKSTDRVLDIGGASQPFRRADAVIDVIPYDERGKNNSLLRSTPERFSKSSWHVQDLCDNRKPFPFKDKEFDFALCGHVLEDVRDPMYIVREMQRVAKRGFIETPYRFYEQLDGLETPGISGAMHHRWFVDLRKNPQTAKNELVFLFKDHRVHLPKYHLTVPSRFNGNRYPYLNPIHEVLGLYWEGEFDVYEDLLHAVRGSDAFMLETLKAATKLGDALWDQNGGLPVSLTHVPAGPGIFNILDLRHTWGPDLVKIYDLNRKRSAESYAYEETITHRSPKAKEHRLLKSNSWKSGRRVLKRVIKKGGKRLTRLLNGRQ